MKTRLVSCLVASFLVLSLSGCASMFSKDSDAVHLDTDPEGATVLFNGGVLGKTPLTTDLHRQSNAAYVVFQKDGYAPKTIALTREITGAAWFNLGFISTTFGVTSWGIDYNSGKMFRYSNRSYVIPLDKKAADAAKTGSVSALDYVIGNYDGLRGEIARGERGKNLSALCAVYELRDGACANFLRKLSDKRTELIAEPHSLAMYRAIDRIAR